MKKDMRQEEGFTLIELLVVILIIAILIAVAVPSFLGQQNKAWDSNVKQTLTVAYKAAQTKYLDEPRSYLSLNQLETAIEDSESFDVEQADDTDDVTDMNTVYILSSGTTQDTLYLGALSKSGIVWTLTVDNDQKMTIANAGEAAAPQGPANYEESILADNPLLYYRLNNNSGSSEVGGSTLSELGSGINYNQPGAGTSTGNSWGLNNSGFAIPSSDLPSVLNSYTVEFFIKPTNLNGAGLTYFYDGGSSFGAAHFSNFNEFTVNNAGSSLNGSVPGLSNGVWQHVAVVKDMSADQVRVYVNGSLSGTLTPASNNLNPTNIDHDVEWGYLVGGHPYNLQGDIDEVAIYNRALSGGEIANHYAHRN